jgi:hypothetical protein
MHVRGDIDFDLRQQFTIEYLSEERRGGYPRRGSRQRLIQGSTLSISERFALANLVHEAKIITACVSATAPQAGTLPPSVMGGLLH